jgi:hypothetical protein
MLDVAVAMYDHVQRIVVMLDVMVGMVMVMQRIVLAMYCILWGHRLYRQRISNRIAWP